jgi:hypothetical protein
VAKRLRPQGIDPGRGGPHRGAREESGGLRTRHLRPHPETRPPTNSQAVTGLRLEM